MRELKMKLCVLMLPLVVSACGLKPPVQAPCVKPPPPPAWIMQPAPDWQTPLNGIISSSENG
ncbi:TPA: Rz1 family lipoprotein [Escherichia coli]|uniref:Rz1 family lipoprotein n=1 Tax=Escherichia coli TaxID=562 RepID=A0AAW4FA65_ECOLX|nr:Rz1 family lipoprotein [Escherichia coli]ELP2893686.1 Rz1 family lipoprotein [Escherichia coli O128]HBC2947375.1 Rz1 family lipoprotein [Escherichia coli O146]HDQ6576600.1 Rz1 family lipoprotein [Escherichia coli O128:H2]HDQ6611279.1 Rz1 family lipoprotein [Escherichia coli Ou:H21]HDQ6695995.1 Rz1 family lipoprotein [Escherichia coli O128AB:H2]HDQ6859984.1 Rz1 family lipoprotein [Escherichia coli O128AC:H2]HDQ6876880.1 Rz1 family lipoprotein [Escherichia coli O166:H28]